MKKFIDADFLLENEYSRELYHNYAKDLPLIDFHCHLNPQQLAEDQKWDNIAQLWFGADSYKWRVMRGNGVDEYYCTGDAPDREKFQKFAETMPELLRSPMYHLTHMELSRFFGIDNVLLSGDTAEEVWKRTGEMLSDDMSARNILLKSKAEVVCTNDDPTSSLEYHNKVNESGFPVKVLPSFRPDAAFNIESENYTDYLEQLERITGLEIRSYDDLLNALKRRHDYFHSVGCRVSNYEIDTVWFKNAFYYEVEDTFKKAISSSEQIAADEVLAFKSAILLECAAMDHDKGWVRQLHIGAMRNTNKKMYKKVGADKGFDAIGESNYALSLSRHLNKLNTAGKLGKTIFYNSNPKDNAMMASILGDFQGSDFAGKLQLGGAWWGVMDNIDGIKRQLDSMSSMAVPGRFVGCASDARSFLSLSRHEYFRRALCNILGTEMKRGLLPADINLIGSLAKKISYENAKNYFAM